MDRQRGSSLTLTLTPTQPNPFPNSNPNPIPNPSPNPKQVCLLIARLGMYLHEKLAKGAKTTKGDASGPTLQDGTVIPTLTPTVTLIQEFYP